MSFRFGWLPVIAVLCVADASAQELPALGERYELGRRAHRADLPGRLDEISGLAFTPDGRLFAHGDERGWVHELDPETGEVGKRFMLGERTARDDFEGIAVVGERFFLISSRGLLYETREGADREEMPYRVTDLGITDSCEAEGLEYHPDWDELLVLCKTSFPDRGTVVIHRIPVSPDAQRPPPIQIRRAELTRFGLEPMFHGSALTLDPSTGTLIVVSGREEAMIEVTTEGRVLAALELSRRRHAQSEGLAIGPNGTLYVADEKNGRDARLTQYRPAGAGAGS